MANYLDGKHVASDEYRSSVSESKKSDSINMACDYYHDLFCEICADSRERNIKPEGFCNDCVQFLCEDCLRVHRRLQAARGHVIRKGDDMPKSMADKPPKFDYCDMHQRSRKDQFCGKHMILLCAQFVLLQHKGCPVESVEDACKGIPSSEIDTLHDKLRDFKTNLSSVVAQIGFNITDLGAQSGDVLKDAQSTKDEITSQIEKLFQAIKSETKSTYETYASDLGQGKNKLNDFIVNLEGTLDDIDKMKGNNVDIKVFLKIQDILKDIEQYKFDVEQLRPSSVNINMSFIPDKRIGEFLKSFKMGSISVHESQPKVAIAAPEISFPVPRARSKPVSQGHPGVSGQIVSRAIPLSHIKAQKLGSYNVMRDEDEGDCYILNMAITNDGRPLLVDDHHRTIKMYSRKMAFLYSLTLSSYPLNIAVTGDKEAVVSDDEDKLLILDIFDRKISIKGKVSLPYTTESITPYKDKFLVTPRSAWPSSIELIDRTGKVYWSTDTDQRGQELFTTPRYVTCFEDGGSTTVIVSDYAKDTLTMLNADTGDVIIRRKVADKCPEGVTADMAGNIYVCYHSTHEVAVLSKDLTETRILLSDRDGLSSNPQAIVYNAVDHQLLVSNVPHDSVSTPTVECFALQ